jgi:hypothetical protein
MNLRRASIDWVLDPPRETLTVDFVTRLPKATLFAALLSSIFSYALAKALLVSQMNQMLGGGSMPAASVVFVMNFSLQVIGFFSVAFIMSRIARLVTGEPSAYVFWVAVGCLALLPLHLTLPLAMICQPLGQAGRLIYAFGAISLWGMVIRRWAWGAQNRYAWPFWGALLVVLSPFLIGSLVLIISAAFIVMILCLALLGMLA